MTLSYFADPGKMEFAAIFGPFSTLSPGENARNRLSPLREGGPRLFVSAGLVRCWCWRKQSWPAAYLLHIARVGRRGTMRE